MIVQPGLMIIEAEKYTAIEATQGPRAAIAAIQKDVGSTGEISIGRTSKGTVGDGRYVAQISDMRLQIGPLSSALQGFHEISEGSVSDLLRIMLDPNNAIKIDNAPQALLAVGPVTSPRTFVEVKQAATLQQ